MTKQYDFKKEWEKTREQLNKFSKEAVKIAKKGEKELVKFSRQSKLHVDSTAISLKKEHLFYLIGKEYAKANAPAQPNSKLKSLLKELDKADRDQTSLKKKIERSGKKQAAKSGAKRKSAKKTQMKPQQKIENETETTQS